MAIFNTVPPLQAGAGIKFDGERISTAAAPRNWLDNSDFTNLVAQAGIKGKHGSVVYAADRWKLTSGTVSYAAGVGLTLNGTITQVLEKAPTGGSCFVGMASGTATIGLNGNTITITSRGGVLKWAAMYGAVYSAAATPEYQPKGYGEELAECLRYYYRSWEGELGVSKIYGVYVPVNGRSTSILLPAKMRVKPTITLYNPATGNSGVVGDWTDDADVTASVTYLTDNYFMVDGEVQAGKMYELQFEASADL